MEETGDNHRHNLFDFLRITAALAVLVSHQLSLTGRAEWGIPGFQSLGGLGLLVFFTMSGYLVCESWQRDPNLIRFAIRRFLRIWPGLAVAVLLAACLLGPLMTTLPLGSYFGDPSFTKYFENLRFNDSQQLAGVFAGNPVTAVNGSMWTLPIEVRWYGLLALGGLIGALRWRWLLATFTLLVAVHYFILLDVEGVIASSGDRGWKEELGLYFLAGACIQRFESEWCSRRTLSLVVTFTLAALVFVLGEPHFAYWIVLTATTINIALISWRPLATLTRRGDFSYGLYVYAFPVQQTIVALTHNTLPFAIGLSISVVVTLGFAVASWHLVEASSLRLKPSRHSTFGSWRQIRGLFVRPEARMAAPELPKKTVDGVRAPGTSAAAEGGPLE